MNGAIQKAFVGFLIAIKQWFYHVPTGYRRQARDVEISVEFFEALVSGAVESREVKEASEATSAAG